MAKRKAEKNRDKSDADSETEKNGSAKKSKPAKEEGSLDPSLPNNVTLPIDLSCPKTKPGCIKIAAWNVSGVNASIKKGFESYVDAEDADILIITETKLAEAAELPGTSRYPHQYWGHDDKKGYAGVAVFSKIRPMRVTYGLPGYPPGDAEGKQSRGRLVVLEFPTLYLLACYAVNAGQKLKTLDQKVQWNNAMTPYLRQLDADKPIIWAGDLNVAHREDDLRRPKQNHKTAGFAPEEREAFEEQLNPSDGKHQPLYDTYRHFYPDRKGQYSYYSFRFECRRKQIGWRVDYFVASERLKDRITSSEIRSEVYGASDHVPIVLEIKQPI